jgi:hypothetical protein
MVLTRVARATTLGLVTCHSSSGQENVGTRSVVAASPRNSKIGRVCTRFTQYSSASLRLVRDRD